MPELPEVNTFKKYFDASALQTIISKVVVHDDKIIRNISGRNFAKKLKGRTFINSDRHGKYLFANLDNSHSVLLHFGMTGDLVYYHAPEDRPRFERFVFHFQDGGKLAFDCPRKFARILYLEDSARYLTELGLGPDALKIDKNTFIATAQNKKTTIKGFLLNQNNLAGVGNLYADEICYQARIHPASRVHCLSLAHLRSIFNLMQEILQKAVDRKPYYKDYPEDWFWQWRQEGFPAPKGKGEVVKTKVAGRTTYYCSNWQKLFE